MEELNRVFVFMSAYELHGCTRTDELPELTSYDAFCAAIFGLS